MDEPNGTPDSFFQRVTSTSLRGLSDWRVKNGRWTYHPILAVGGVDYTSQVSQNYFTVLTLLQEVSVLRQEYPRLSIKQLTDASSLLVG